MIKAEIISILEEVKDPEIPVLSISDLGILRNVDITDKTISIQITPTYSGCPAMETIQEDIRSILKKYGFDQVEIKQVLSPAWTSDWMTESGKQKLEAYGIAAPLTTLVCMSAGEDRPAYCPHCFSNHVTLLSRFGSTACKALYKCLDCLEPFDYFKCH